MTGTWDPDRDYLTDLRTCITGLVEVFEEFDDAMSDGAPLPDEWAHARGDRGTGNWLAVAVLAGGTMHVAVPPDGQPLTRDRAEQLAEAINNCQVLDAVGIAAQLWQAECKEPDDEESEPVTDNRWVMPVRGDRQPRLGLARRAEQDSER